MLPHMKIMRIFLREEDGAVTVDWVALTAGVLLIGIFASFAISSSVPDLADHLSSYMANTNVGPS